MNTYYAPICSSHDQIPPGGTSLQAAGRRVTILEKPCWPLNISALFYNDPSQIIRAGENEVVSISFNPRDSSLAVTDGSDVRIWNPFTEEQLRYVFDFYLKQIAFSPNGSSLAVGLSNYVILTDPQTGNFQGDKLAGLESDVKSVAFNPLGGTLAVGCEGGNVTILGLDLTTLSSSNMGSMVNSVSYSVDGRLAAGLENGNVVVVDALNFCREHRMLAPIKSVAFSLVDNTLAVGLGNGSVLVEDSGRVFREFGTQLQSGVNSVSYSYDGFLAAGLEGGNVIVWEPSVGEIQTFVTNSGVTSVAFSNGGHLAAGLKDGNVLIWSRSRPGKKLLR